MEFQFFVVAFHAVMILCNTGDHMKLCQTEWSTLTWIGETGWQQFSEVSGRIVPRSYWEMLGIEPTTFCLQSMCSATKLWFLQFLCVISDENNT